MRLMASISGPKNSMRMAYSLAYEGKISRVSPRTRNRPGAGS